MSDLHSIQSSGFSSEKSSSASDITNTENDIDNIIDVIKYNEEELLAAIVSNLAEEQGSVAKPKTPT